MKARAASWLRALALLAAVLPPALAARPGAQGNVMVNYQFEGLDPPGLDLARQAGASLRTRLGQEFKCASFRDTDQLRAYLQQRRAEVFDPSKQESSLEELHSRFFGIGHLVVLRASPGPGAGSVQLNLLGQAARTYFSARADFRAAGVVASSAQAAPLIQRFVAYFATLEVCPYRGVVSMEVATHTEQNRVEQRAAYCNQQEGVYRKQTDRQGQTRQTWTLRKQELVDATGSVWVDSTERHEETEEDACHTCASGRQGGRTEVRATRVETRLDTLSRKSRADGEQHQDAIVRLHFEEGDRYFVTVKASTASGPRHTEVRVSAQGTCDNVAPSRKESSLQTSVALEELRLGPFTGSGLDKRLRGRLEIPVHHPDIGETGTRTLDFDLERD